MNRKSLNPNVVSLILIGFAVLIVAILPISIRIEPITTAAQETATAESSTVSLSGDTAVVEYTLRTVLGGTPPMAFVGVGGEIDGIFNPTLHANVGDTVRLTVINGDPVLHDLTIAEFNVTTGEMTADEQQVIVEFVADQPGTFVYYCSVPGHREVGMFGVIEIAGDTQQLASAEETSTTENQTVAVQPAVADAVSIVRDPTDVPPAVGNHEPTDVRVELTTQEVTGRLADGTTFNYFTFDGTIPGPMIRVREGDTVEIVIRNADDSLFPHSIDLHSVTGPGGGAVYTQTNPGGETSFTFQALNPGLYVYHCATPSVAHHIANGMYGLILVEPEGGLPPVDREFYIMQGEVYTAQPFGTQGHLDFSYAAMLDEDAEYFVFNGAALALASDDYALQANVGDTVRIYFGVGGPNATSSFHVIGEIFDRVYDQASLTAPPLTDVQTTTVPPGGATMVEFAVEVPGRYVVVDHALSRLERGLAGYLNVEGEEDPTIFHGSGEENMAGH